MAAKFLKFRNTDTNEIVSLPAHFKDHPVFGLNLVPFDDEIEVDKVVKNRDHALPVEQRIAVKATDTNNKKKD